MSGRPAAVLWDMDGTLVDTEPYWIAAERALVESHGGEWPIERAHAVVGFDLNDTAAYMIEHGNLPLTPREVVDRLLDDVIAACRLDIPWRPGARELLADLNANGIPCALVTMSWRNFGEAVLAELPPHSFDISVFGDEVSPGKPHPAPYLRAAELLQVDPRMCIAIEDSPTGVASARAAGCKVIAVPNVKPLEAAEGVLIRETLVGLTAESLHDEVTKPAAQRHRDSTKRSRAALASLVLLASFIVAFGFSRGTGNGETSSTTLGPVPPISTIDAWIPYWAVDGTEGAPVVPTARLDSLRAASPFWYATTGYDTIGLETYAPEKLTSSYLEELRQHEVEVVPSILDRMPAGSMASILSNPVTRAAHIATILEFARSLDADGIDIDYEQFAFADDPATWFDTQPNWVAFIIDLADALHADGRTLAVSVPAVYDIDMTGDPGYWVYDHGTIAAHVDSLRIMAYDYSVIDPGPIAPVSWVSEVLRGIALAVPEEFHSKVVIGIPSYGYNWPVAVTGICPSDAPGRTGLTNASLAELITLRNLEPIQDVENVEWTATYDLEFDDGTTSCVQTRELHWVDADGVAARVELVRRSGFTGVALWALGYEDEDVWQSLLTAATKELTR